MYIYAYSIYIYPVTFKSEIEERKSSLYSSFPTIVINLFFENSKILKDMNYGPLHIAYRRKTEVDNLVRLSLLTITSHRCLTFVQRYEGILSFQQESLHRPRTS